MAILTASPGFAAAKGDSVTVTLSRSELAAIITGDAYYANELVMRRVVVVYKNENQVKVLDFPEGISEDIVSFSEKVKIGTFEILAVQIQDFDNGAYALSLTELNAIADADFVISDDAPLFGSGIGWGYNFLGPLGDNSTSTRSSPVSVSGGFSDIVQVSASFRHSAILRQDGTVWTTGEGFGGRLGVNDETNRSTPTLVVGQSDFKQIATTRDNTIFLKSNGEVWITGTNSSSQLGDGLGNRSSPIKILNQSNFSSLVPVSTIGGNNVIMAIKSDGTMWGWGSNSFGALGINNTDSAISSPTIIIGQSDFKQAQVGSAFGAYTVALKSDGTLWATGDNGYGNFGDNSTTSRSSFTQIPSISNVNFVACSDNGSTYAIKSDGTLWVTGSNSFGALGLGNTTDVSSFVQVTGHSNFKKIEAGSQYAVAQKSDGTMWAVGNGNDFRLGTGITTSVSTFTQITLISEDVIDYSCGSYHTIAIKN